jgi:hypothetical protein
MDGLPTNKTRFVSAALSELVWQAVPSEEKESTPAPQPQNICTRAALTQTLGHYQHRPKQVDARSGQRECVPNHGLAAVVWILLIAFTLSSAFVMRHSKRARLYGLSTIAVAAQLRSCTSKIPPSIRAPD